MKVGVKRGIDYRESKLGYNVDIITFIGQLFWERIPNAIIKNKILIYQNLKI